MTVCLRASASLAFLLAIFLASLLCSVSVRLFSRSATFFWAARMSASHAFAKAGIAAVGWVGANLALYRRAFGSASRRSLLGKSGTGSDGGGASG